MTRIGDPQRVPDWLLGGRVRRRVLERLAEEGGYGASELAKEINAGEATVFEVFRALRDRPLEALERTNDGRTRRYRLKRDGNDVARALLALVEAGRRIGDEPIPRPPSRG